MTGRCDPAVARAAHGGVGWHAAALCVVLVLAGLAVPLRQARAAQALQTFGPGRVNCQALTGTHVDCLLATNQVTSDNSNVATFSVTALPPGEQASFRKWCLAVADECAVTVTGRRASPQGSRLSRVTSVHWTRPSSPVSDAVARVAAQAAAKTSASATAGPAIRPAQ